MTGQPFVSTIQSPLKNDSKLYEKVRSVMIVDDDIYFSQVLADDLREEGYIVQTVREFENMSSQTANILPDVLLIDYYLPDSTGVQILREMESHTRLKYIKKILMSGETDVQYLAEKMKIPFLEKPFEMKKLFELLYTMKVPRSSDLIDPEVNNLFNDLVKLFVEIE